jgi:hypothetical protein
MFAVHMSDLGTPAQSFAFLEAIAQPFPNLVRFACAYLNDQPIAYSCGFLWGSEFESSASPLGLFVWHRAKRTSKANRIEALLAFSLASLCAGFLAWMKMFRRQQSAISEHARRPA